MAADTKDAPGKAPLKSFSLRSRLLGIPADEKSETGTSETAPETETPLAEDEKKTAAAQASAASSVESDDDQTEDEEAPRVGVALTPRRGSLLSAFGLKKQKPAEPETPPPAAAMPAPVDTLPEPEPEPEPQATIVEEPPPEEPAPNPILDTPSTSLAGPTQEPLRERVASLFRSKPKVVPVAEPEPAEVSEFVEEPVAVVEDIIAPDAVEEAHAGPVPFVRFHGVKKTYDGVNLVVKDLNLDIAKGEFLTLLGPSGSGKTTTLMMLAGFEQPTAGDIMLNGTSLTTMPPHQRGLGFVFQNYALFPHMTVAENLAFPLEVRKTGRSEIRDRVQKALAMVELEGFDKRKPHQLSGGQQQRIAVARALVFDPELVLMDEPLGALDKHLREQMQYELKRLHRELGVTVVYVTHDQGEALTLSNRIAVFHEGIIQQLDTPTRIYDEPSNAFVAGFIGENNALPGKIVQIGNNGQCTVELIGGTRVKAANGNCDAVGRSGVVCVRPEHLSISSEHTSGGNNVTAMIEDYIFHGDHLRVKLSAPGMHEIFVKAPARGAHLPAKGVAVTLSWEPGAARAFVS